MDAVRACIGAYNINKDVSPVLAQAPAICTQRLGSRVQTCPSVSGFRVRVLHFRKR